MELKIESKPFKQFEQATVAFWPTGNSYGLHVAIWPSMWPPQEHFDNPVPQECLMPLWDNPCKGTDQDAPQQLHEGCAHPAAICATVVAEQGIPYFVGILADICAASM